MADKRDRPDAASMENSAGVRGTVHEAMANGESEDILALQDLDPALNMKMHLVNNVRGPGALTA